MFWVWDDWWTWGWSWLRRLEYARWLFLASALAKGGLIRVYKPIAQLSLFLESLGNVWWFSALSRVTLVLVPSCEGEFLDIPSMKFWGYFHSFYGKRFPLEVNCVWLIDGANLNICECYNESDRLQLLFSTGIIFPFCMCARVIQRLASMSLFVFEKLVK